MQTMKYFLGRIVTVVVPKPALDFGWDDQQQFRHAQYFTGRVEQIDDRGIWMVNNAGARSYFILNSIIGICEELQLPEDHPLVKQAVAKKEHVPQQCHSHMQQVNDEPELINLSMDKFIDKVKGS